MLSYLAFLPIAWFPLDRCFAVWLAASWQLFAYIFALDETLLRGVLRYPNRYIRDYRLTPTLSMLGLNIYFSLYCTRYLFAVGRLNPPATRPTMGTALASFSQKLDRSCELCIGHVIPLCHRDICVMRLEDKTRHRGGLLFATVPPVVRDVLRTIR